MNWPTTSLMRLKDRMRDRDNIDLIDLPQKWKTWLAKKANPWSGDQEGQPRGPRGAGTTNAQTDGRRPRRRRRTKAGR